MNEFAHEIIQALYDRLLYENDIALVDDMLYSYGRIHWIVIKARIRRRNNREFIRRSCVRMQYKRESERENNPQRLRRGRF